MKRIILIILTATIFMLSVYLFFIKDKPIEEASIIANMLSFTALVITIVLFMIQLITSYIEKENRKKALEKEIEVNHGTYSQLSYLDIKGNRPFQRYYYPILIERIKSGEINKNKINSYWSLYISMEKSNRLLDQISEGIFKINTMPQSIEQIIGDSEIQKKIANLKEEIELSRVLFQKIRQS